MEEFYEKAKLWLGDNFGGLFDKIKDYAKTAGRIATKPCLELYFILKAPSTSTGDKALIIAALVYGGGAHGPDSLPQLGAHWVDR